MLRRFMLSRYFLCKIQRRMIGGVPSSDHRKVYGFCTSLWDLSLPSNPSFSCCGISSLAFERSFQLGTSLRAHHPRYFCTIEPFEADKDSAADECDHVGKVHKTVLDHARPEYKMEAALDGLGVKLTSSLVVEVLHRLRFDEKLALRFFTWAGHSEYYSHEAESYNKMIDILSCTKPKAKQFGIVCDVLDHMKRSKKPSVPIDALLTILKQYTEKHLAHLQKIVRKKKKIRVKSQPEINAFNLLLDAFCKCSLVEDAESMFERVKNKVNPNMDTYNILFFGWCRVRNPTRAMRVLENMISNGHTPENFTYNTAIDTFCKAGMLNEATELLEFMKTKGSSVSSPTAKTFSIMIIALAQNGRMDLCFKILSDMMQSGCLPDVSTYKELIEGMYLSGKPETAYKFLDQMTSMGYPPDIVTYNCFLKVLCDHDDVEEALLLYKKMVESGCIPSVQTYNIMISMFFRIKDFNGSFETWDEMERRGCMPDTESYCSMIEGLFGCGNSRDAVLLLDRVMNMGMKFPYKKFDEFLAHLSAVGDLQTIHRLSDHMRQFYNPAMARRFAVSQKRRSMSLRGK